MLDAPRRARLSRVYRGRPAHDGRRPGRVSLPRDLLLRPAALPPSARPRRAAGLGAGDAPFIQRAVIGSTGLQANSVAEGMLYRLILQPEMDMLIDDVALKQCPNAAC